MSNLSKQHNHPILIIAHIYKIYIYGTCHIRDGRNKTLFIHSQTANLAVIREAVAVQAVTANIACIEGGKQPYNTSQLPSETPRNLYTMKQVQIYASNSHSLLQKQPFRITYQELTLFPPYIATKYLLNSGIPQVSSYLVLSDIV